MKADIIKWFKLNQKTEFDILNGKDVNYSFSSDDLESSIEAFSDIYDDLPTGNYKIRARKAGGSNNSYVYKDFSIKSVETSKSNPKMEYSQTEKQIREVYEERFSKMKLEFTLEFKIEKLEERIKRLESTIEKILDDLDDLFDNNPENDKAAKDSISNLVGTALGDGLKTGVGEAVTGFVKDISKFKKS